MKNNILIFIPTYNERSNVTLMCERIVALGLDADLLFIDDNSPDGTGAILNALSRQYPRVSVLHRPGKEGIGSAHQAGLAYAYDHAYEYVVSLDCDFTHSPEDIPRLLDAMVDCDIVVGSRHLAENSLPNWNLLRRALTRLGHFLTVTFLGLPQDATGALRCYHLTRIPRMTFALITARSYPFFFESLYVLVRNGHDVREIPIVLPARVYGHSKLTLKEAVKGALQLLKLSLENWSAPERFLIPRKTPLLNEALPEETAWEGYWSRKNAPGLLIYEFLASTYRRLIIRRNLEKAVAALFQPGAALLHGGCGSGQVDMGLSGRYAITAVDISPAALLTYCKNNPEAARVEQASIFTLPYVGETFDGCYNLGVVEHFTRPEIIDILKEFRRVLKPGGAVLLFWPHRYASSAYALQGFQKVREILFKATDRLHPPELTPVASEKAATAMLYEAGLRLESYTFTFRDGFVQACVVGRKPRPSS